MDPVHRPPRHFPGDALELLDHRLPASDLRTLLLGTARVRAAAVTPADVVRRWRDDRFVRPATCDPRKLAAVEARVWSLLPDDVDGVDLSPVAPLGTVAAVTGTSQDRVVTTTRLTEVVSDSTNALAVEAAVRRTTADGAVHLATCQRQLRAQDFGAGATSHFRLFCLVSSARATGSRRTETDLLLLHLDTWCRVLAELVPTARPQVRVTLFDDDVLAARWHDTVLAALDRRGVDVVEDPTRTQGRGYYRGLSLKLFADAPDDGSDGGPLELGDGGFTDWTALLRGDAKERCLVSCLATERLASLV